MRLVAGACTFLLCATTRAQPPPLFPDPPQTWETLADQPWDDWELDASRGDGAVQVQADGAVSRDWTASTHGLHAALAYALPGTKLQAAVRAGALDLGTAGHLDVDLGLDLHLRRAELQLAYTRTLIGEDNGDQLVAGAQLDY